MNVLHYTIGLPPYRHGGAARYVLSLALEQESQGLNVGILVPGNTLCVGKKCHIRKSSIYKLDNIPVFEISNPVVSPLLFGVSNPGKIYSNRRFFEEELEQLYRRQRPDILHLHTLMGLPEALLVFFQRKGVRIVMTSHDYYGICPRVNLLDKEGNNCEAPNGEKCAICNLDASSYWKQKICNSNLFVRYKHLLPTNRRLSKNNGTGNVTNTKCPKIGQAQFYERLLDYYKQLFSYVSSMHFNSSLSKEVYERNLSGIKGAVIPITLGDVKDNRKAKDFSSKTLRIGFIGGIGNSKGFPTLVKVLTSIGREYGSWELNVWDPGLSGHYGDFKNIMFRGGFSPEELSDVYGKMDVLIVPSQWRETFSLVTLEALSFGTPVIVSGNVGAKDIVRTYGREFVYDDEAGLRDLIVEILQDRGKLVLYNQSILEGQWLYSIRNHTKEITSFYQKV